jgi:hypothetical protein
MRFDSEQSEKMEKIVQVINEKFVKERDTVINEGGSDAAERKYLMEIWKRDSEAKSISMI